MRGVDAAGGFIYVGSSNGACYVISSDDSEDKGMKLQNKIQCEQYPISSVASSGSLLAIGDENGNVHCFDPACAYEKCFEHKGCGFSCTSVVTSGNAVIAGFSSGHIRVFQVFSSFLNTHEKNELVFEIAAHIRSITGLSMHPYRNMIVSCSEDQYIQVWAIPNFLNSQGSDVDILFYEKLENKLLTGVSFLEDGKLAAISYDHDDLLIFIEDG
jgi:WD40 repeat protein